MQFSKYLSLGKSWIYYFWTFVNFLLYGTQRVPRSYSYLEVSTYLLLRFWPFPLLSIFLRPRRIPFGSPFLMDMRTSGNFEKGRQKAIGCLRLSQSTSVNTKII
jgi:hypothetical protein